MSLAITVETVTLADGSKADVIRDVETVKKMSRMLANTCSDWAEDHTHLENLCIKAGVPADRVHGDNYGVPGIIELADMLAEKTR